ncbi:MAG TPA: electron transport complex subunit RsxC [Thermoanaerobaculia bacterium]|nr:electron transport complex subunit RsxC [Thermoanaerobaculia bacterium]
MSWPSRRARTFPHGVHPPEEKQFARDVPIEVVPTPAAVAIPLLQHLGAPCQAVVASRATVALGDVVGRAEAPVSAPVHASIAGVVQRESVATLPNGRHVTTVPIKAAGEQLEGQALYDAHFGGDWPLAGLDEIAPAEIVAAAGEAGLVGMGGAAFPTHVKLAPGPRRPVDTVLINGCECEPYLTADERLMREAALPVLVGAKLVARAVGAKRIVVGIEANKPEAIAEMRRLAPELGIEVGVVATKYPQGAEKQLVYALLQRIVPGGKLPLDVGVVVSNVATAAALARAVLRGAPLTHRVMTVAGHGVREPKNLLVPIGLRLSEAIEAAGGLTDDAARVIAGGPMMGFSVAYLDAPVTKGTSGLTVLAARDLDAEPERACVRCGRCVDVCPMGLLPTRIALAARYGEWELAGSYHARLCVECGCCAFACPSRLPLVQLIRVAKARLAKMTA